MSEPERKLCSQTTASGSPCRNYAIEGSDRCASHLRLTGPKTTLTLELIEKIALYVKQGNHVAVACRANGVPKQTFSTWWTRAAALDPDGELTDNDVLYLLLRERVGRAEAEAETRFATLVSQEAPNNPAWAAWMLERKWPERWARVSQRSSDEEKPDEEFDPFKEVDELAERRRKQIGHES